jgi:drug/metabolite transporter (DMT)-like permease
MEKNTRTGIVFALVAALISGFSVFVNGIGVKATDPLEYTLLKNLGALLLLAGATLTISQLKHFKGLSRKDWTYLLAIGIIGGSVPFAMFFTGLSMGGAVISSFIYRSLFVFAGIFGFVLLREKLEPTDAAISLLLISANAILLPENITFGLGQALVLGATILWALEYTLSRKILSHIHPNAVMISRFLFGSIVLFAITGIPSIDALGLSTNAGIRLLSIAALILPVAILLAGFAWVWYRALAKLPVFRATAILTIGGIITAILDASILGKSISPISLGSFILITAGVALAIWKTNPNPEVQEIKA